MKLESFKERWMGGGFPKRSTSVDSELEDSRIDEPSLRLQFNANSDTNIKHDNNMNNRTSPDANVIAHDSDTAHDNENTTPDIL